MTSSSGPSLTSRPRRSSGAISNGSTASSSGTADGAREKDRSAIGSGCLETPRQNALLGVQAVLGLVEYHGLRSVNHLVGDLVAAVRRQAMHEQGIGFRQRHQMCIDLIGPQHVVAVG